MAEETAALKREEYAYGAREGFLSKKAKDGSKWAKRFFCLSPEKLLYYISAADMPNNPKDSFPILHTTVRLMPSLGKPNAMQVRPPLEKK